MTQLLYVIDDEFTFGVTNAHEPAERTLGDFHLVARCDNQQCAPGTTAKVAWSDCVEDVANVIRKKKPQLVIVLAHQVVFRHVTEVSEEHKTDGRIDAAERDLDDLPGQPTVFVRGFHHEPEISRVWNLLQKPYNIDSAGLFRKLRAIVEDGGGPFGQLSSLKHNLMRPFSSVRLLLQLDAESGAHAIDSATAARVADGVAEARTVLKEIEGHYAGSDAFRAALADAKRLVDRQVGEITSTPHDFNVWTDELNVALDSIRAGVQ